MIEGRATPAGTRALAERTGAAEGHFRTALGLCMSSVGIGTGGFPLLADADAADRAGHALEAALLGGVNVVDTSSNYADGDAERIVGRTLGELVANGSVAREELVLCSKAGYLPDGGHSMEPAYLDRMIDATRESLGVETVDVFLVHNPEEQLEAHGPEEFERRMRLGFEALEGAAAGGRIGSYGVATAEGFRTSGPELHRLDRLVELAREAAGGDHRLGVIELPLSLASPEALFLDNHRLGDRPATVLDVARDLGLTVFASAAVNRGRLPQPLPAALLDVAVPLEDELLVALQFTRSAPGVSVALVGMSDPAHVHANLELMALEPLDLTAEVSSSPSG